MVGPNPHRLHSFGELRAIIGQAWIVCEPCNRYATVPTDRLKDRDTRTTPFSCSLCGLPGKLVTEDPGQNGRLQADTRENPQHHPHVVNRYKVAAALEAHSVREGRRKVPREDLPQRDRRKRPKPAPPKLYALKPFPVQTFADIAIWGLNATIDCRSCRRRGVPLDFGENLKTAPLLGIRLRCTDVIPGNVLMADRVCGGRGRLQLTPAEHGGQVPIAPFFGVSCYTDSHTGLDVGYLVVNRPPWQGQLGRNEHFACPGCGREMTHAWHTTDTSAQQRW